MDREFRSKEILIIIVLIATVLCGSCLARSRQDPGVDSRTQLISTGGNKPDTTERWHPSAGSSWQWDLSSERIDSSHRVDIYDIDLFENDANLVAELQARESKVICYLNVGSWENWRPDAAAFPEEVLGKRYQGWPGEYWLDIRQLEVLGPIMEARLDQCQEKGFDGVEPDILDGFQNDTGFPLTYQDQLTYNLWLADQAHRRGLSIGLKNNSDQAADLVPYYDFALTEDCFFEGWCGGMDPFLEVGKAVFAAEYTDRITTTRFLSKICPQAKEMHISVILKHRSLDSWRLACP